MALALRFGAASDVGRSRKKNDDSGYAGPHLLMIADGMGGAPAGDLASAVAVQSLRSLDAPPPDDLLETLAQALRRANDRLAELIDNDPAVVGMGTTVTAALFDGHRIGMCHLGDSRGYLWRKGKLLPLTHDHTWVQSLIDEGRLTEEEAKTHSHRSLILKVLDGRHDNAPDLTTQEVEPGDRIMLCSDGLSGFVDHDRIERVLAVGTAQSVAEELTQLALEAGSTDNITVVVADVVEEPASDTPLVVGAAGNEPRRLRRRLRAWAPGGVGEGENLLDPDIDPEELRYAPRAPKRFLWLRRGLLFVIGLALITALGVYSYRWTQQQYYVAAADGKVAIYQGVDAGLPGLSLHRVYETQDLLLSELPSFRRTQVIDGLNADNITDAEHIVEELRSFAAGCAAQATSVEPGTTVARSPSTSPEKLASSGAEKSSDSLTQSGPDGQPDTAKRLAPTTQTQEEQATPTKEIGPTRSPQEQTRTPSATTPADGAPTKGRPPTDAPRTDATTTTAAPTTGTNPDVPSPEECSGATPLPEATP